MGKRSDRGASAVEQLAATSEILRAISRSPGDTQPVFDTIAASALQLCHATSANVFTYDGTLLRMAAQAVEDPRAVDALRQVFPRPADRGTAASRAVLTRSAVAIHDVIEDPDYVFRSGAQLGFRSVLGLPLLRNGMPIGAIAVGRSEPGPYPERQIALLQTFADQAVIAIENARLFRELQARNRELTEALDRQTATSEILRIISRSPTNVQPVFDSIAAAAARLCNASVVNLLTFDGSLLQVAALVNMLSPEGDEAARKLFPRPPGRGTASSMAVMTRDVVHIPDLLEDPNYEFSSGPQFGVRSVLGIPLLRDGEPIGALAICRPEPGHFPDHQIALLQTFADQAVIAIENARLFRDLQARTQELQEALERQSATSQVLSAISRSPTELTPVLDTIVRTASRLVGADHAGIMQLRDGRFVLAAAHGAEPEFVDFLRDHPPAVDLGTLCGRTVIERRTVYIEDTRTDPRYEWREAAERGNYRTALGAPLLRQGDPIGVLWVAHKTVRAFTAEQVALITTFADQGVIAIENVRLFSELQSRTTQLTRTVEQLQALAEVGQAVSSTLDLETVLATIVSRATELTGMDGGVIYEYDESQQSFVPRATDRLPDELTQALRDAPMYKGEGAVGRVALHQAPVAIGDIADARLYQSRVRQMLLQHGYRSLLAVPLLREDRLLGGLVVHRRRAGEFEAPIIELLKAFATQSALAIQNARLFREIEEKSRQLEIASRHKSAFLANMSHELRTPLNAIIGFARIVMRRVQGQVEAKQYENLEKILASAQHLLALINAILDIAKVEAGRVEVRAGEVALAAVLEQCMRTVEPLLHDGVTLETSFDPSLPPIVADEEKLRQIVINLLSNAAKFTSTGRIRVAAQMVSGRVEIAVADTGIGIPADKLESIFEEFEQVDASSTRTHGGTGLGLAIARRLARLLGGDIRVDSVLGTGATFTLTLPLRYRPAE